MSCAAVLLACLAQGAYIEARALKLDPQPVPPPGKAWRFDPNETGKLYGVLAVGVELPVRRDLVVMIEARHQSIVTTANDRGENSIGAGVRWFPGRHP